MDCRERNEEGRRGGQRLLDYSERKRGETPKQRKERGERREGGAVFVSYTCVLGLSF